MKILSIDTTHGDCSVALLSDGEILAHITDKEEGKQAERLLSIVESVLAESKLGYSDLSAVAVNVGPGSFTGVRIGMAAAKGLNLVHKMPLIAVTSFESVAYQSKNFEKNILVVLDAKRGQVYCQMFAKKMSEPALIGYNEILDAMSEDNFVITGNGCDFVKETLLNNNFKFLVEKDDAVSDSISIAYVAADKLAKKDYSDDIYPLYIRNPDAKIAVVVNKK
jgi:tRNA threonylcarbamoyladenosine biosynthesis protein TsaB